MKRPLTIVVAVEVASCRPSSRPPLFAMLATNADCGPEASAEGIAETASGANSKNNTKHNANNFDFISALRIDQLQPHPPPPTPRPPDASSREK